VAFTDTLGHYSFIISENDSLWFTYGGKSTAKFPVNNLTNYEGFDIAIHITMATKYKMLPEARAYGRNYKLDSLQNRIDNAKVFNFNKQALQSSTDLNSGVAGFDADAIINAFRFRHNRNMEKLRQFLIEKEQDDYIDYRFNKKLVKRITLLDSTQLEKFMKIYRPSYEFTSTASEYDFHKYILQSYVRYMGHRPPVKELKPAKKED
jgi:plasmid maintenance system killer protein